MAFDAPARQALPPNLVPPEHLTNALSLNNIMRQTATILGPGLVGFVIAWHGVAAVYWINAASFLAVLIALVLMKVPTQQHLGTTRFALSAVAEGIRFVWRSQILLSTTLLDFFGSFFSSASALLPIFAKRFLRGTSGLGESCTAAESAGAVVAGVGMSWLGNGQKSPLVLWALAVMAPQRCCMESHAGSSCRSYSWRLSVLLTRSARYCEIQFVSW
jgi:MFS family permease